MPPGILADLDFSRWDQPEPTTDLRRLLEHWLRYQRHEFLRKLRDLSPDGLALTQVALAEHLGVPVQRINELVRGKRGVTPETAWLLAGAFGTTPDFWIYLQTAHDLAVTRPVRQVPQLAAAA